MKLQMQDEVISRASSQRRATSAAHSASWHVHWDGRQAANRLETHLAFWCEEGPTGNAFTM